MKVRGNKQGYSLEEVLSLLPDKDKTGISNIFVGKNYSLRQLIEDLEKIKDDICLNV